MLARFDQSDGLGAIYPPIVWSIVALKCLGYPDDSPEVQYCHQQLQDLVLEDEETGTARLQPCKSPVWDTAITVRALAASGMRPDNPAIREAVEWLLARQITRRGDWAETVDAEPGGWCFEYANDFYPDCDDTAMALLALQTQFSDASAAYEALPPELRLAAVAAETRGRYAATDRLDGGNRVGHRPGPPLAAGHAESRRRLGGLRPEQRPRVPLPRPLRRP